MAFCGTQSMGQADWEVIEGRGIAVVALPPNKWLKLTVQLVTSLEGAGGAPSCPAAEPGC